MSSDQKKRRIEFGDFQTPDELAIALCERLSSLGINPQVVIEPTCGVGAFVLAAAQEFSAADRILGFDVNGTYLDVLRKRLSELKIAERVELEQNDFFSCDWYEKFKAIQGSTLVIGNFPWVTNSTQGAIGGSNLPKKSNFLKHSGFDAISGKANFDISEWMLLEVLNWFRDRSGDIAMLVKTAVARKILAHAERQNAPVGEAFLIGIDAKRYFGASVDACLLVIRFFTNSTSTYDYRSFKNLEDSHGHLVGHRLGFTVNDLEVFDKYRFLVGKSPKKWRSGIKHDASKVMEFTLTEHGLENGLGELVELEQDYLFPLLKGSDVGSEKVWRRKYTLVTQHFVGESTAPIMEKAPKTWQYLLDHAPLLDSRGSTIYAKNPRFSIFGVGDYAFQPWRIAICALYKNLRFRLVGPIEGCPVMFDDTIYYISFATEEEAKSVFNKLNAEAFQDVLSSLIFWDEKRPIKTSILNALDWSKLDSTSKVDEESLRQPLLVNFG